MRASFAALSWGSEAGHWLIAEAVNRLTSPIALRLLHRRAALTLEADTKGSSATTLWDGAEHWTLAGESRRASVLVRKCAQHSLDIGRPREAAEILIRAAQMVVGDERIDLAREAIQLADAAGEYDVVVRASELVREFGNSDTGTTPSS